MADKEFGTETLQIDSESDADRQLRADQYILDLEAADEALDLLSRTAEKEPLPPDWLAQARDKYQRPQNDYSSEEDDSRAYDSEDDLESNMPENKRTLEY